MICIKFNHLLLVINSSVNIFIYCVMGDKFRCIQSTLCGVLSVVMLCFVFFKSFSYQLGCTLAAVSGHPTHNSWWNMSKMFFKISPLRDATKCKQILRKEAWMEEIHKNCGRHTRRPLETFLRISREVCDYVCVRGKIGHLTLLRSPHRRRLSWIGELKRENEGSLTFPHDGPVKA